MLTWGGMQGLLQHACHVSCMRKQGYQGGGQIDHHKEGCASARAHLSVLVAAQAPARLMTCCTQYSQKGCPFALASQALGMACARPPGIG